MDFSELRSLNARWSPIYYIESGGDDGEGRRYEYAQTQAWITLVTQQHSWDAWDEKMFATFRKADNVVYVEDRTDLMLRKARGKLGVYMYVPVELFRLSDDLVATWRELIYKFYARLAMIAEVEPPPELQEHFAAPPELPELSS